MDYRDQALIQMVESAFGMPKDALHTLADRKVVLPDGVKQYWKEKMDSILWDYNLLMKLGED